MTDPHPSKKSAAIEELVAYLDGELSDEQSAAVEERMRNDPQLRQTAEQLDRTWGMLDILEPVSAGAEFSRQTVETVVATYSRPTQRRALSPRRIARSFLSRHALGWFVIGVLGTLIGLGLASLRGPSKQSIRATRLLGELEMLDRYPQYTIVPDIDTLRQLQLPPDDASSQGAP